MATSEQNESTGGEPVKMSEAERREAMNITTLPNGKTKGFIPGRPYLDEDLPDFIGVQAENGAEGFVRKEDYVQPLPSSLEEAAEMNRRALQDGPKMVPVFGDDGETIVGEFKIGGGIVEEVTADGKLFRYNYDTGEVTERQLTSEEMDQIRAESEEAQ